MRVLYDANIFISYLLNDGGSIGTLFEERVLSHITLLLPEPLLTEFVQRIETKPYLSERISRSRLADFSSEVLSASEIIPEITQPFPTVVRDPKDDYLIAYAIVGEADYLVTGDKDLLVLQQLDELHIITPEAFVKLLSN